MIAVVIISAIAYSQDGDVRFAISPFVTLTAAAEQEKAGDEASELIEQMLASQKWFQMRKKGEISAFLDKLAYAQAGGGDADEVMSMGKNLQINYLTVGSIAKFGSHYEVDSRSVDINTWMIVHSAGCSAADLGGACSFINKDVEITLTKENLDEKITGVKDKPTLAVFKFIDANDDAAQVGYGGSFSEILNSELGARNGLAVMERTHLKAVIDAKQLEMCGVVPNDDSSGYFAVRGIAYKFEGSIKLFPQMVCISYRVLNTKNNRLVLIGYSEINSVKGIRPLARKIARDIDDSINNRIGSLEIKTDPDGADVLIDKQPYGKAPVILSLNGGNHSVVVSLSGYETVSKDITVTAGKVSTEKLKLAPLSLTLYTDATLAEKRGDWKAALAKYDEFIAKYNDTNDVNNAYFRKGYVLLKIKDYQEALKTFEALVGRYPDAMMRSEAYFGIAQAYKEIGNQDKVRETLQILRDKFPNEIATENAKTFFGM
jgi:tetratricopeptide (TPR) repeat protein